MDETCSTQWMRKAYAFWSEYLKGRDHSEDRHTDGRIILK